MADGGVAAGEVAGGVAAGLAVLAALGKAVQWIWAAYRDAGMSRSAKLDRWHDELLERERALKQQVDADLRALRADVARLGVHLEKYRRAFGVVAGELYRRDGASAALREARDILDEAFPLHLDLPPDMAAQIDRLG